MTVLVHEPGTYRTRSGELIHFRIDREGGLVLEREDDGVEGKLGGLEIELVKLSDDPDWPDVRARIADIELFAD